MIGGDDDVHDAEEAGDKLVGQAAGKPEVGAETGRFSPGADGVVHPALSHQEKDHLVMGRDDSLSQGEKALHSGKEFEGADVADHHVVLEAQARHQSRVGLPGSKSKVIRAVGHDMEFGGRHLVTHQVAL